MGVTVDRGLTMSEASWLPERPTTAINHQAVDRGLIEAERRRGER